MKIVLGVVIGAVVAFVCVFGVELIGHTVYPPPEGLDLSNPADVERLMAALPAGAFAFVLAAWFVGALAGAWVANKVAGTPLAGWIVAALVVCGGVATMLMIPHPAWMWAAGILLPVVAGWLAQRMSPAAT